MNVLLPKFSVIIPQKNRAEYLIHTLKTCMIQDYPNFEVIVGDDCSDDNSVEVVKECMAKDSRIKLIAHNDHVGMRDNFESALAMVRPGYVMALGGDDGLVPGCIWRMYEILKETGVELLTWTTPSFVYPDGDGGPSSLNIRKNRGNYIKIIKSEDFLNSIASSFFYLSEECPMFYIKGVASTKLVDKVKSRTADGCFYYCPTPDGFSGVVLAGEAGIYAYTNEPLSIMGTTIKSQGRNYLGKTEQAKRESKEFFNDNIRRTIHHDLASQQYSPLISLMTADFLLTARDLPGWPGKYNEISFENLLRKSFKQMQYDQYETDALIREMEILKAIAEQHNLLPLYNYLARKCKRKIKRCDQQKGSRITPRMIILDAEQYKLSNLYEASLAVKFATTVVGKLTIMEWIKVCFNTVISIVRYFNYKKEPFPRYD